MRAGEPIVFNVRADEPGSLHVHSTPEHELEYGQGTTDLELVIDQPGVVEVESHELGAVATDALGTHPALADLVVRRYKEAVAQS